MHAFIFEQNTFCVPALWIISVAIDIFQTSYTYTKEDVDETDTPQKLKLLGKKVLGISGVCFDWGRVCSLRITLFGLGV